MEVGFWRWNLFNLQKPVHKYSKSGIYSVTLTVSNAAGTGTMSKHNYIDVTIS